MTVCASCGIPLTTDPDSFRSHGQVYCCAGCAAGGPCMCTYEQDLGRYPPAQFARPVSLAELLDRYESALPSTVHSAEIPRWLRTADDAASK